VAQADRQPELVALDAFVGEWSTEAVHRLLPDTVVTGRMSYTWLEGERFLLQRATMDHPDFPDALGVLGFTDDELTAHYFDSRGVFRVYRVAVEDDALRMWRDEPGFSQRMVARLSEDGSTITATAQLSQDDASWEDDLSVTYTRVT